MLNEQMIPQAEEIPVEEILPIEETSVEELSTPEIPDKENIRNALDTLTKEYMRDEFDVRLNQLKIARRNNAYWNNKQDIWWDDVARDWRKLDDVPEGYDNEFEDYQGFKFVNLYKAYGESIIASLSSQVPSTRFFPEDADNPKDVAAAKAYTGIAELNRKHNESKMLIVRMLCILFNEQFCAVYNYVDRDSKYGTTQVPREGVLSIRFTKKLCPNCGNELSSEVGEPEEIIEGQELLQNSEVLDEESYCSQCNSIINPLQDTFYDKRQGIVDYENVDKIKVCKKAYGTTNVSFPAYCREMEDLPYIILETEISYAKAIEEYPELALSLGEIPSGVYINDTLYSRTNFDYLGQTPRYTVTKRQVWLRNWALNRIGDLEIRNYLKEQFKEGVKLTYYNDVLVTAVEENLLEHWSLSINPLNDFISSEPMGNSAVPLQDIANNLLNLTEDTIEHGIGETFASQEILDLERYRDQEIRPGQITPTKSPGPNSLSNYFYQLKPASMSPEISQFGDSVNSYLQHVLGAFPSIFGGAMPGGSNTLGEYQESRTQALQRLQLTWVLLCNLWADMEYKSIRNYAKELNYDENKVEQAGSGYRNIWIRAIDLDGNVNNIEPESAEYFPINWAQKKNVIDGLMQQKSPIIDGILSDPNNIKVIASAYGMGDIYIPGDDDRNKQIYEIAQLVHSVPQPGQMTGEPQMTSSIPIEPEVDNHAIHIATCKAWAVSELGQAAKAENPEGYQNVLLHMKEHQMAEQQQMMEQMMQQMQQMPPEGEGNA